MTALAMDLLKARRILIVGISIALLFTSVGYLALYPSIRDQLAAFSDDLPDAYRALLGDVDIATAKGYVRSQVYSLIAPLVVAGAAISAGSSLARAEQDQTLAVLAVSPLSRRRLASSWLLHILVVSATGAAATALGVVIGAPLAGAEIDTTRILLATLPVFLFAVLVGSAALVGATSTGSPALATGLGWMTILISFVVNSLAELIDGLEWLTNISPWAWHQAGQALTGQIDTRSLGLSLAAVIVVSAVAIQQFDRRNLHL